MRIKAGYRIAYNCPAPTPMLLMVNVRPERRADLETPDTLTTSPSLAHRTYLDSFGNLCTRLVAPPGHTSFETLFIVRDSGEPDPVLPAADQTPIDDLPDEAIQFLLPSRYCDMEQLTDLAWKRFGSITPGWRRVQSIVDYVHERVFFGYQHARATRTAFEAHEERAGVCRDYAHLAITLCRCVNIPSRYCTGYLGDIGVEPLPPPMDFSAWFQVWLGGAWRTFDARHNRPRIGRVLMAVGRDAADVAIATTFGTATLSSFEVFTDQELADN